MKKHLFVDTGWSAGLCAGVLLASVTGAYAGTTINAADRYAYGANIGWVDARGDITNGAALGQSYCTGYLWGADVGWIGLGNGPANGWHYSNASATDWGVGEIPDLVPFSFFNRDCALVGHDVEMAYDLARALNLSRIEFVPVTREDALDRVNAGDCDIVMAGLVLVPPMTGRARYTAPYIDLHPALVARDDRAGALREPGAAARAEGLRVAVAGDAGYDLAASALLPRAVIVPVADPAEFFNRTDADALLTTAEAGTPLTLLHPFYAVAELRPAGPAASCVYALARDCDDASLMFVDYWLAMEERSGALEAKYDRWVLGKETETRAPRWSVVRDVLGWAG